MATRSESDAGRYPSVIVMTFLSRENAIVCVLSRHGFSRVDQSQRPVTAFAMSASETTYGGRRRNVAPMATRTTNPPTTIATIRRAMRRRPTGVSENEVEPQGEGAERRSRWHAQEIADRLHRSGSTERGEGRRETTKSHCSHSLDSLVACKLNSVHCFRRPFSVRWALVAPHDDRSRSGGYLTLAAASS